ncbi:MAG TPA: iron-sulfur cluster assembly accessory protein [Chloroflexia bacterium]|nr:iron-sulfur cluster assembly accessory protein [Chloroflexia bacterium]
MASTADDMIKGANTTLLTVTDEAREQLKALLSQEANPNLSLRVFVQGARAAMALDDTEREEDVVMDFDGLRVLVDEDSAPFLAGAIIGYQDTLMDRGFTIENANLPQSGGGCGCGGGGCGCGCGH